MKDSYIIKLGLGLVYPFDDSKSSEEHFIMPDGKPLEIQLFYLSGTKREILDKLVKNACLVFAMQDSSANNTDLSKEIKDLQDRFKVVETFPFQSNDDSL